MKKKSRIGYAPTVDDGDNDEEGKLDDSRLESDDNEVILGSGGSRATCPKHEE